ncbi:cytochrome bc complex cytochrome b subunit [uncultured Aquimonas sp.]|jgi:ubiquinol-cytochrome c reductase cytochrome b subunit|uniref:cytochrome b n=1 Tax=uncultured Aquimonas sp. TaxID=385483 RepID=UPI00086CC327|nr:cytochrome bc complex cytochrome b subunit [uncultured Aquimonas sp.]ODU44796.1 MAG: cytochrome B [Xanthomonadaceae bacterium SCN 69-123]
MSNLINRTVENVTQWVDERAPGLKGAYNKHVGEYYAPKNFNVWYYFGSLAMLVLVNQIVTGIWLTMNYKPSAAEAFASVEYIMRDVEWGWLIRYMHSTGASLFFVVVYLHMFRGLVYGSSQKPRELVWVIGVAIFLVLMAEAFLGYVLPWGQMSYHGAQVIINLFGAVPVIGTELTEWIRGDFLVSDATLNRFFALHVIALPLVLLLLVVLHLGALHEVGSNNPDGVDIKKKKGADGKPLDGIPFHPYYTVKDLFGAGFFLTIAAFIVFFAPTFGDLFLEYDNFVPANPMVTPDHIKPVWYFTPYYAMLRAVPDKLAGVMIMGGAVMILFLLPWLDRSPVRSVRYRGPLSKLLIGIFVVAFVSLAWLGLQSGSEMQTLMARIFTIYYFAFFLLMPLWTRWDSHKPVPERVTTHD